MATVLDFAAGPPSSMDVKRAGHAGAIFYISPGRASWMTGKNVSRSTIDAYKAAGLGTAAVWQFGAGTASTSDVMRGRNGGLQDANAAKRKMDEIGLPNHPVFFAVDFDITLSQWNSTAVHYFKAAVEVLGRERVGIYGHSRVIAWAKEDNVVATVAPGRVLGWQTLSWSGGVKASDYAVLYQGTHNVPGPSGVQVDINTTWHENWGQKPVKATSPAPSKPVVNPAIATGGGMKNWYTLEPNRVKLMNKHFSPGRGGHKIEFVTLHHTAGVLNTDQIWNVWQSRAASAHYLVEPNGTIGQLVWDRDTAWGNANLVANQKAIIIEHSNSAGPAQDWPISEATLENGARLVAALCWYYKLGRPRLGTNVRTHNEFTSTSCPYHLRPGHKYHNRYMERAGYWYDLMASGAASAPSTDGEITVSEADRIIKHLTDFVKGYVAPIGQDVKDIRAQLTGSRNTIVRDGKVDVPASYPGWPQLGQNADGRNLTVTDAVAALRKDVAALQAEVDRLKGEDVT